MPTRLQVMQSIRKEKLANLKALGHDPYTGQVNITHTIQAARNTQDVKVVCAGRVVNWRGHGKLQFLDLVDESGKIQLAFKADILEESSWQILENLDIGDFIEVGGTTFTTKSGEITIEVKTVRILTKAIRPLPNQWHGLKDVEERYRQRYVDLNLNPQVKQTFITRSKIITHIRHFFDSHGFLEVETPILQPIYGGATAKPFLTHHNALDVPLYLRIADELYLKRLIVGGFEKVYEIGHDFRNEGLSRAHSPEFTQIEFYWAYANYEQLMELTEKLFVSLMQAIKGSLQITYQGQEFDFTPPWPRLSYREVILKHAHIDIDEITTELKLIEVIIQKNIKLDRKGVVGYSALLDSLYKKIVRPKLIGPLFLVDYPYEMKPLAKRKPDKPHLTANFQLLINGEEYVNAYNELNDPADQHARWEEEIALAEKGLEEHQVVDYDYIRALEYGMPPTAGWGLGVDRLTMLLTDQASIKDVILFPTLKPENFPSHPKT